jgi:hypothetical protein
MTSKFSGGCACGAIRYEIDADPIMGLHCQCRACQRASGAGHSSFMGFPKAAMRMTGEPHWHERPADSGNRVRQGFCTKCGSPVVGGSTGFPDMVTVMATSLDDPKRFTPNMVVFTKSAQPWDPIDTSLPSFPGMPPMGG